MVVLGKLEDGKKTANEQLRNGQKMNKHSAHQWGSPEFSLENREKQGDGSYNGLMQSRMLRCKERREVPYDGSGSPEESSELASGDMIGREKIIIYYTRDFSN